MPSLCKSKLAIVADFDIATGGESPTGGGDEGGLDQLLCI